MSVFDGMQPTRAQIVPHAPSLISIKLPVRFFTSRNAASPAVPAPTIMTSNISLTAGPPGLNFNLAEPGFIPDRPSAIAQPQGLKLLLDNVLRNGCAELQTTVARLSYGAVRAVTVQLRYTVAGLNGASISLFRPGFRSEPFTRRFLRLRKLLPIE